MSKPLGITGRIALALDQLLSTETKNDELIRHALLGAGAWLDANKDAWIEFARRHVQAFVDNGGAQTPEKARALMRKSIGPFMLEDLRDALAPMIDGLMSNSAGAPPELLNASAAVLGATAAQRLYASPRPS